MALMIAEMANVFLLYIDNEVQFRKHHLIVERSLARWKVSTALKRRADNFLTSWWSSHAGVDYQLIFEDLPASVRTEGILTIAKQPLELFVHRVFRPLFRDGLQTSVEDGVAVESKEVGAQERGRVESPDCGARFHLANLTYSIAKYLRFEGYPRGENIIVEGSVCKAMYFVVRGYLLSKSISNTEMYPASRYRGGDYFGEIGLLGHSVSLMTVTSIRACDLFVLNSDQLLQALESHPYFSLVLATAQLAVKEEKTTSDVIADWFAGDENDEDIDSGDNSFDDSDDDEEDGGNVKNKDAGSDAKLRRGRQQLRSALRGASQEVMDVWAETFALFIEMLVPKGSMGIAENHI
ncbi:Voltage-gated Ion Channel (VIC) Superfamily [Phytophthora palmivora]|uniref:Voltage-gated Ion Channel (VIC) Superfamily n=1 Tax=Phytophthora palmivora TaxID=4796 RepID=A0A2P4XK63_9STRA|nr:Voltage-gated Ion Channel (VIC) Superfamily [Phytophthora palmivora]